MKISFWPIIRRSFIVALLVTFTVVGAIHNLLK